MLLPSSTATRNLFSPVVSDVLNDDGRQQGLGVEYVHSTSTLSPGQALSTTNPFSLPFQEIYGQEETTCPHSTDLFLHTSSNPNDNTVMVPDATALAPIHETTAFSGPRSHKTTVIVGSCDVQRVLIDGTPADVDIPDIDTLSGDVSSQNCNQTQDDINGKLGSWIDILHTSIASLTDIMK